MGDRTSAYYGHVDPGNGVWNLGSFSYQHGAQSPEEADVLQLRRLRQHHQTLLKRATDLKLSLTLMEELNAIDLANQAPLAAVGRMGYMDRLVQAQQMGMQGAEAVLWARTRSFIDPDTQRWDAPGLGNTVYNITRDQQRRMDAIATVMDLSPLPTPVQSVEVAPADDKRQAAIAPEPDLEGLQADQAASDPASVLFDDLEESSSPAETEAANAADTPTAPHQEKPHAAFMKTADPATLPPVPHQASQSPVQRILAFDRS
jgi:hypothetical protein